MVAEIMVQGFELDSSIPIPPIDPILTAGTLWLFDAGASWPSGVPANGGTVPNLAWEQAATVLGSGTEISLALPVVNAFVGGTDGKIERTTKGGSHVSNARAGQTMAHYLSIQMPAAIRNYVQANPAHPSYTSLWMRITVAGTGTSLLHTVMRIGENGSIFKHAYQENTSSLSFAGNPTTAGKLLGRRTSITPMSATALINHAYTDYVPVGTLGQAITYQGPLSSTDVNQSPSTIIYRGVYEDLTLSGRTYADVDAQDAELFAQAFAVGGRYAGDTFSPDLATAIPASAAAAATVTVTGAGFTGVTSVTIGGIAATSYNVVSETSLTFVVPVGSAGSAPIIVTNAAGASFPLAYTRT